MSAPGNPVDTVAGEVARRWRCLRDLDRHPRPGSVEREITIVEHLKWIAAAYSEEHR